MPDDGIRYHLIIAHPEYDQIIHRTFVNEEEVSENLGKYLAEQDERFLERSFIRVIKGLEIHASVSMNAVVVKVGKEKFLVDGE